MSFKLCTCWFAWLFKCLKKTDAHRQTQRHLLQHEKYSLAALRKWASIRRIVPSRRSFSVCFKHSVPSAVFAISAMGIRGDILLRAWILMGFLSEKTGHARITPLLYHNGFSSDWTLTQCLGEGGHLGLYLYCQHFFFGQCLHKSSSSTICLLPRSLESGREQWDIFHVARSQLGPQYNASLLHWLHVSGVSGQCFALYTKSAKNNHPYHFTYINTQPVKYYQVKHTGAEYDWSNPTSPVS